MNNIKDFIDIKETGLDDSNLEGGYYFQPLSNNQEHFIIQIAPIHDGSAYISSISEIDTPDSIIENGTKVKMMPCEMRPVYSLEVWPKYYLITYPSTSDQFYHKEKGIDYLQGRKETLQYALDLAIKAGGFSLVS